MEHWKENVHFILVEPSESGNIGASARAIKNMGFNNLSLVNPPEKITEEADRFAHNAMDVLVQSKRYPSLTEALADKSLVIGTSRLRGRKRGMVLPIEEAARKVFSTACGPGRPGKVAILFGREQSGLAPEEIDECAYMINVPTDSEHPSLNLAQAVMVVAYELGKQLPAAPAGRADLAGRAAPARESHGPLSTHSEQAVLFERIKRILELLGYTKRGDREIGRKILLTVKHFLGRADLTGDELDTLSGICTRLVKKLGK